MGLDNPSHIAVIVIALVLIFGARRLPEIGRSLGQGMREFKESVSGESKQPAIGAGEQTPAAQAAPAPPAAQPATPEPTGVQSAGSETVAPQ
jgi:sec-independent protein translocase protein TatA